jgi:acetylornithine/N-succinyldiaminopimelate aminotransferase
MGLLGNINRYEVSFERGEGVWLYDTNGDAYLDMLGGVAVCALGHAHPAITEAIRTQAGRLLHVSNLFYTPEIVEAADLLTSKLGGGSVYFCNSGTEANEAAIKAARKHAWRNGEPERNEIVAIEGSFHGRTYGSLAATIQPAKWEGFDPMPAGFSSVPINDVAALDAAVTEKTAAIMIEPIQGEGGIRPLSQEFATAARKLATDRGALLIADEIQTGVGRTGRWWGYEHLGIGPDIVTLAKALGGGFPVGATWFAEHASGALRPGDHSTTQGGGPLACAALIATLQTIESDGLLERCAKVGEWLAGEVEPLGAEVRGAGLLIGLELDGVGANDVVRAALGEKLICNDVTPTTVRLAPALIIGDAEAEDAVGRLAKAIVTARKGGT